MARSLSANAQLELALCVKSGTGSFRRSFRLPTHVTGEAISTSYDAGVLTVRVAGAHKGAEAQRIAIERK